MKKRNPKNGEHRRLFLNYIGVNAALLAFTAIFVTLALTGVIRAGGCLCVRLFHLYCPACGGTRATLALLRGELLHSLAYNPAIFVGAAVGLYLEVAYGLALVTGDMRHAQRARVGLILLFPLTLALVFLIRNGLLLLGIDTLGDIL
jgi:hypothetical protein